MEPHTELIDELPRLFAKDLNAAMAQQEELKRIVLFFDAHEAFWGHQRDLPEEVFFQRDEWLRCFLRALDLDAGIVAVVAGREKPRWAEANPSTRIPQQYLDTRLVGHFSAPDARDYLQKADVKDAALQQSLIDYASVAAEEVHPLYLGLCADVVLAARAQGNFLTPDDFPTAPETLDKSRELINRLLRYVDKEVEAAVHALSACRAFDFELYLKLGQALHFHATRAAFFDILTRFSFVWQAQRRGENWYRIHDLLRRLDDESGNEITRRAHEVLEQHYREKHEIAEAIYHANRLDWERSVETWVAVFDAALWLNRYEQCRTLLDVRSELSIPSNFQLGNVSLQEGNYFARLAQYDESRREYLDAINAYEQALSLTPDDFNAYSNKGIALQELGNLLVDLSGYQEALHSYEQALICYNQALNLAPNDFRFYNNKGNALSGLGELQAKLLQYQSALRSYKEAVIAYNQALQLAPDDVYAHNNKGIALTSLGDLLVEAEYSQYQEAWQNYEQAIASYDQALTLSSDDISVLNNKGNALTNLGSLQLRLSQTQKALQSYEQAVASYDQALKLTHNSCTEAYQNKGIVLTELGELQVGLSHYQQAIESYKQAITVYEQALEIAPNTVSVYSNKGLTLSKLGELQTRLSQHQEALQIYEQAIATYNQAIRIAPHDTTVHKNKGLALHSLGFLQTRRLLQVRLLENKEAIQSWQAAVTEFSDYLEIAPGDDNICNRRDNLQEFLDGLGEDTPSD
jgi:tetratricopeptide (TPR) repeat protein